MFGRIIAITSICVWVGLLAGTQWCSTRKAGASRKPQSEDQQVRDLLDIVLDKRARNEEPERVVRAIERLGEMRSTAAIAPLVQLLTFSRTFSWENKKVEVDIVDKEHPVGISGRYPAAGALFMIGKSALPALVEVIEEQESVSVASINALYTIRQIFRDSPTEVGEFLRNAAAKAPTLEKVERLIRAAESAERQAR